MKFAKTMAAYQSLTREDNVSLFENIVVATGNCADED
jgi:hypothetical protein